MKKPSINETTVVSRFVDQFFRGIISNTADRFLKKAAESGVESEILTKLKEIHAQSKELDAIIKKYSK